MASIRPNGVNIWFDLNGNPNAGGKVYTYASGTTTPKAVYADAAQAVALANPVVLDAFGKATLFWDGSYKVVVTDRNGVTLDSIDPVASAFSAEDFSALGSVTLNGRYKVSATGQHTAALYRAGGQVILAEDESTGADSLRIGVDHVARLLLNSVVSHAFSVGVYALIGDNALIGLYNADGMVRNGYVQSLLAGGMTIQAETGPLNLNSFGTMNIAAVGDMNFYANGGYRGKFGATGDLSVNGNLGTGARVYANSAQVTPGTGLGRVIIQSGGSPPGDGMEGDLVFIY